MMPIERIMSSPSKKVNGSFRPIMLARNKSSGSRRNRMARPPRFCCLRSFEPQGIIFCPWGVPHANCFLGDRSANSGPRPRPSKILVERRTYSNFLEKSGTDLKRWMPHACDVWQSHRCAKIIEQWRQVSPGGDQHGLSIARLIGQSRQDPKSLFNLHGKDRPSRPAVPIQERMHALKANMHEPQCGEH